MREPVARAYSHYCHHMRFGVTCTFEEAIEKDNIYLDCSNYLKQIKQYLEFFPVKNFLFVFYENFKKEPTIVLKEILNHLSVKQIDLTASGQIFANVTGKELYIRSQTTQRLKKIPLINTIKDITPLPIKDFIFHILMKTTYYRNIGKELEFPPMSKETLMKLVDYFIPYNKQLETLIGKNKPNIWNPTSILGENRKD